MNLYLSSFRLGNRPAELQKLIGENKHVAVIANAVDFKSDQDRKIDVEHELGYMSQLGFDAAELDLRNYFAAPGEIRQKLDQHGAVWARGGNAFLLRQAMKKSGFDTALKDRIRSDPTFTYAGYSAGVVVLTPTLEGIEIVDDARQYPPPYDHATTWEGLGILDYSVAPHFRSEHPESQAINKVVEYFENHHLPYKTLRDGEVILVRNGEETILF